MKTAETLARLIVSKTEKLDKLEKKLARIEAVAAANWADEANRWGYSEYDLRVCRNDLARAQKDLENCRVEMEASNAKAARRNVPAISDFLDKWAGYVVRYYMEREAEYREAAKETYGKLHALRNGRVDDMATRKVNRLEADKLQKDFTVKYGQFLSHDRNGAAKYEETLRADVEAERLRKYDTLLDAVENITGVIVNASGLNIAGNGDLEGVVRGRQGNARVNTFGAGGYNIQCYHFRTRVTRI